MRPQLYEGNIPRGSFGRYGHNAASIRQPQGRAWVVDPVSWSASYPPRYEYASTTPPPRHGTQDERLVGASEARPLRKNCEMKKSATLRRILRHSLKSSHTTPSSLYNHGPRRQGLRFESLRAFKLVLVGWTAGRVYLLRLSVGTLWSVGWSVVRKLDAVSSETRSVLRRPLMLFVL